MNKALVITLTLFVSLAICADATADIIETLGEAMAAESLPAAGRECDANRKLV
ncbi:MAG: hypothetical protein QF921_13735 [Pseudomonadales bacterium]|jgi:hypothetical protein|nr:hypothetical protein [Pseudomonadales bacterium]MDP6472967.1 hypothetical protein [Pseudomonadales bacterium]MDP6826277.1 hypothetical protein [Pseudomonadales bacterium]MDP6972543.1 hypothetical protein [Pseudomonadales bacterium]|tara:strand:- start:925 stop:1083 length:159 start_codon:yes stop_codon:yes gene_type:complete